MLPLKTFDKIRFASEDDAKAANEIYHIEYSLVPPEQKMIIIDPAGNKKEFQLNFYPRFGLDVSDHQNLAEFLDNDMTERAKLNI